MVSCCTVTWLAAVTLTETLKLLCFDSLASFLYGTHGAGLTHKDDKGQRDVVASFDEDSNVASSICFLVD